MEEWRYSSTTLDLGTRRRWVVSLTPKWPSPREGWVGPRAGLDAAEKSLLLLQGFEPRSFRPEIFTTQNELYRLKGNKLFGVLIVKKLIITPEFRRK
jgi:hypothetical protein